MLFSGIAAERAVQLRRAHIDMRAAILLGFIQKAQQGLPKIFGLGSPASADIVLAEMIVRHWFPPGIHP